MQKKTNAATAEAPFEIRIPKELEDMFLDCAEARAKFDTLPQSHQREYVEWIAEGKREDTRVRRAEKAREMLTAVKPPKPSR